eukprot:tig00000711_g3386.t1
MTKPKALAPRAHASDDEADENFESAEEDAVSSASEAGDDAKPAADTQAGAAAEGAEAPTEESAGKDAPEEAEKQAEKPEGRGRGRGREEVDTADPARVPSGGAFYLHDDRFDESAPARGRGGGRGRGRGGAGGIWVPKEEKWKHDKFETLEANAEAGPLDQGDNSFFSRRGYGRGRGRGGRGRGRGRGRGGVYVPREGAEHAEHSGDAVGEATSSAPQAETGEQAAAASADTSGAAPATRGGRGHEAGGEPQAANSSRAAEATAPAAPHPQRGARGGARGRGRGRGVALGAEGAGPLPGGALLPSPTSVSPASVSPPPVPLEAIHAPAFVPGQLPMQFVPMPYGAYPMQDYAAAVTAAGFPPVSMGTTFYGAPGAPLYTLAADGSAVMIPFSFPPGSMPGLVPAGPGSPVLSAMATPPEGSPPAAPAVAIASRSGKSRVAQLSAGTPKAPPPPRRGLPGPAPGPRRLPAKRRGRGREPVVAAADGAAPVPTRMPHRRNTQVDFGEDAAAALAAALAAQIGPDADDSKEPEADS